MAFLVAAPLAFHAPALAPVQQLPAVTMKAQGEIGVTPPCALSLRLFLFSRPQRAKGTRALALGLL